MIPFGHETTGNPVKKVNKERRPNKGWKVNSFVEKT